MPGRRFAPLSSHPQAVGRVLRILLGGESMSRVPSSAARSVLTILAMLGVLCTGVAFAGKDVGSVNFTLGGKSLTSDWYVSAPTTLPPGRPRQPALGVEATWGRAGWPVMVALDVLHSYDDGVVHESGTLLLPPIDVRQRASTLEVGIGARRAVSVMGVTPYLGAGGAWVRANVIAEFSLPGFGQFGEPPGSVHTAGSALGFWVGGGIYRRLGPRFQLGLTGRYSQAKLKFHGQTVIYSDGGSIFVPGDSDELDAGGKHIGLVAGWSFPNRK
jgi:hypothetical protein